MLFNMQKILGLYRHPCQRFKKKKHEVYNLKNQQIKGPSSSIAVWFAASVQCSAVHSCAQIYIVFLLYF